MARRKRQQESRAVGHGTSPLMVVEEDPIEGHPALGPLTARRIKRVAGKGKGRAHVKVHVAVEAKTGKGSE